MPKILICGALNYEQGLASYEMAYHFACHFPDRTESLSKRWSSQFKRHHSVFWSWDGMVVVQWEDEPE